MTMLRTMPALLVAGSLALATGCDGGGGDGDGSGGSGGMDRASDILSLEGDAANGEQIFNDPSNLCASAGCHGADGVSGAATPTLEENLMSSTDMDIVETFLNGKGSMPTQAARTDQELADLLAYVTATFG